jgi:hypothetical protein
VVEADLITVIWPLGLDNSRDIDLATVIVFANFFFGEGQSNWAVCWLLLLCSRAGCMIELGVVCYNGFPTFFCCWLMLRAVID